MWERQGGTYTVKIVRLTCIKDYEINSMMGTRSDIHSLRTQNVTGKINIARHAQVRCEMMTGKTNTVRVQHLAAILVHFSFRGLDSAMNAFCRLRQVQ